MKQYLQAIFVSELLVFTFWHRTGNGRGSLIFEGRNMKGSIDFKYDETNDVVIATLHWSIESVEDCKIWYQQWVDFLAPFKRKMDVVMILDDFHVKASYSVEWGQYRARVIHDYTRFTYRVNADLSTGIFVKTSGARYNASTNEANSVEAAIEAIHKDREKAI